jgi:hypothetical protein
MKTIVYNEYYKLPIEEQNNFTGILKWKDGTVEHLKNGRFHREGGPARTWEGGHKEWWIEGKLHNLNGPAKILSPTEEEYWIHGKKTTKQAFEFLRDLYQLKNIKFHFKFTVK